MFSILAAALLIVSGCWIYNLTEQNTSLRYTLQRYSSITSQENFEIELNQEIRNKQAEANRLKDACSSLAAKVQELKREVSHFGEAVELQSFGFYEPQYDFISSEDYRYQLKEIIAQQKRMMVGRTAIYSPTDWTMDDSKKDKEKLVKNFKQLILIIFNTECSEAIRKVKPGRFEKSRSEIESRFKILNKSSQVIGCSISPDYLILKINELHLQYELESKRQEEREISQQLKQDEQDQRKLEKAELEMREAEEKEYKYQQEIDEIRRTLESSNQKKLIIAEDEKEKLRLKIELLEVSLKEVQTNYEEAENRSRMIKAGHVFIVSNIGSFGREVYRICATRSIDEDNYISSMRSIVPFPFGVHYKFFSSDVNETLKLLHDKFQDRRVNTANPRRDFFYVNFEEITEAINDVKQLTGKLKNFTIQEKEPNADEYNRTQQQRKSN
jgi:Domain of unknown function (DUF4041)